MRDEHLDQYHQEQGALLVSTLDKLDAEEIQPLLFDLVKADKVDAVMALLPEFRGLPYTVREELQKLAALSGSPAMLHLIAPSEKHRFPTDLIKSSIQGKNVETFRCLLSDYTRPHPWHRGSSYSTVLDEVLMSDSEVIYEEWEKYVNVEIKSGTGSKKDPIGESFTRRSTIKATAGNPSRENLLLSLWEKIDLYKLCGDRYIGDALLNVALTTCSVKLAKFLIDCGANVDHKRCSTALTPLHRAARQTTAEAAEMMKFLLFQGADPEAKRSRVTLRIRDEKGAKGISKWLGMSWDDLVTKAKKERRRTGDETKPETPSLEEV